MAKWPQSLNRTRGAVLVWILIALIAAIAGAMAIMKLFPLQTAPTLQPVVARGKIPPMPATPSVAPPATSEVTIAGEANPPLQENNDAPASELSSEPVAQAPLSGGQPDPMVAEAAEAAQKTDGSPTATSSDGEPAASPESPAPETPVAKHTTDAAAQMTQNATEDVTSTAEADVPNTSQTAEQPHAEADDQIVAGDEKEGARIDRRVTDSHDSENASDQSAPFSIQVGSFRTEAYAQDLAAALNGLEYSTYIETFIENDEPPLYQVRFGRFGSLEAAVRSVEDFKQQENRPAVVVKVPSR